jgi:hypothetical protein
VIHGVTTSAEVVRSLRRLLVSVPLCGAIVAWFGFSGFGFFAIFQGEGTYSGSRQLLIAAGDLFLLLGLATMVVALWLWSSGRRTPRLAWAAVLSVVLAQLAFLASALSLAHFVRSGETWVNSAWRRLLSDLGLVELFAYYGWVGAMALAVAVAVAVVATVQLFSKRTLRA